MELLASVKPLIDNGSYIMSMKRRLFIIMLAVMVVSTVSPALIYADAGGDSDVVTAYKKFANAFIYGRLDEARSMAEGDVLGVIALKEVLLRKAKKIEPIQEPLFLIVSETPTKKGAEVLIHAVQVVQGDSKETMFQPPSLHRQFVTMLRTKSGWKVVSFKDDQEKCCQ
ncbi:MAG: hypothetical protein HQL70_07860 [Magnetococcales bacterium]|nr:hypothetical protein [Magnetococcales bacterium]